MSITFVYVARYTPFFFKIFFESGTLNYLNNTKIIIISHITS